MVSGRLPQLRAMHPHTTSSWFFLVTAWEPRSLSRDPPPRDFFHLIGQSWDTWPRLSQKQTKGGGAACVFPPIRLHPHLGGKGSGCMAVRLRKKTQYFLPGASSFRTRHDPTSARPSQRVATPTGSTSLQVGTTCSARNLEKRVPLRFFWSVAWTNRALPGRPLSDRTPATTRLKQKRVQIPGFPRFRGKRAQACWVLL